MVLGSETPVNIRKNMLVFIIYYAKDTAAHFFGFPLAVNGDEVKILLYQLLVQI